MLLKVGKQFLLVIRAKTYVCVQLFSLHNSNSKSIQTDRQTDRTDNGHNKTRLAGAMHFSL